MALPKYPIKKIPNTEPDAVPALWNETYEEIDQNLSNLDVRLVARESEINAARGGESSLAARIGDLDEQIQGLDPDMQNSIAAALVAAISEAGLANREHSKTLRQRIQTGEVIVINRGVISGCVVTKSTTATRNVNMSSGRVFAHGIIVPLDEEPNGSAIPSNHSGASATCELYLAPSMGGGYEMFCTTLGAVAPEYGIPIYRATVPAGNTEATDQNLSSVTLTSIRRMETNAPIVMATAPFVYVPLESNMLGADYSVELDVIDFDGGGFQLGYVYVDDRQPNGFKVCVNGTADSVRVRWTAKKPSL